MTRLVPALVYVLCLLTSVACAVLLTRSFLRERSRHLAWIAGGFAALAANNLLLVADLVVFPTVDLWIIRQVALAICVGVLLFGLIWEMDG